MSDYVLMTSDELYHHGILGQKWGVRRYQNADGTRTSAGKKRYSSTSIKGALARKSNSKVDKSFEKWKKSDNSRDNAIELGKQANKSKIAYENDKSNKELKSQYKSDQKAYKQAYKKNTTYRKGVVRQDVGSDLSRKYLSEAKKVKKQLDANPNDKSLQKKYNELMTNHDVERAKARKATTVANNRMQRQRVLKSAVTKTVKSVATTAAITAGTIAVNSYLSYHDVKLNGEDFRISSNVGRAVFEGAKKATKAAASASSYIY